MALFSSSRPLSCDFLDNGGPVRLTLLRLPLALLPLADGRADRLPAEPLPDKSGSGALLGPYLTSLPEAARTAGPAEPAPLGAIGVDLAASLLAARIGDQHVLPAETRRATLLARISAFIDHHLTDPNPDPAAIADGPEWSAEFEQLASLVATRAQQVQNGGLRRAVSRRDGYGGPEPAGSIPEGRRST